MIGKIGKMKAVFIGNHKNDLKTYFNINIIKYSAFQYVKRR
jgi:hypothetical protein